MNCKEGAVIDALFDQIKHAFNWKVCEVNYLTVRKYISHGLLSRAAIFNPRRIKSIVLPPPLGLD
jgi:hypothetical protein